VLLTSVYTTVPIVWSHDLLRRERTVTIKAMAVHRTPKIIQNIKKGIVINLTTLLPNAVQTSHRYQLPHVVGIVIGHK